MKSLQAATDKFAIGLSLVCVVHCLALPVLLALLPGMAALQLDNEAFHFWMVIAVIPSSAFALTLGCKQHKRFQLLILGFVGLVSLLSALVLEGQGVGETGEKILTVFGAGLISVGHWFNYRLCNKSGCDR